MNAASDAIDDSPASRATRRHRARRAWTKHHRRSPESRRRREIRDLSSEDVTSAVVDLNARLTNERRIEQELLELLVSRADAPLHEIVAVRKELADVRLSIERLSSARELLARHVSLATVHVVVRRPDAPAATKPTLAGLLRDVPAAATRGFDALARSVAIAVQWSIGGALLWAAAGVAFVLLRRIRRRRAAATRAPIP